MLNSQTWSFNGTKLTYLTYLHIYQYTDTQDGIGYRVFFITVLNIFREGAEKKRKFNNFKL